MKHRKLDAHANYFRLLHRTFPELDFPTSGNQLLSNNVIGALNNPQNAQFRRNFKARLVRLQSIYKDSESLTKLRVKLLEIANPNNWQGAFAELTTLDYFNFPLVDHSSSLLTPVEIGPRPDRFQFLGDSQGTSSIEIDGNFPDYNVCFDTKALIDVRSDILDGMHGRVRKIFPEISLIMSEYPRDFEMEGLSGNVSRLQAELVSALTLDP